MPVASQAVSLRIARDLDIAEHEYVRLCQLAGVIINIVCYGTDKSWEKEAIIL